MSKGIYRKATWLLGPEIISQKSKSSTQTFVINLAGFKKKNNHPVTNLPEESLPHTGEDWVCRQTVDSPV